MNHKQKLGYTALGALIMLIGIGAGSIVSPPLIAQRDGVFGEIQCTRLTVVDKAGNVAVFLGTFEEQGRWLSGVNIYDKRGKVAVALGTDKNGNGIGIYDKTGNIKWRAP